MDKHFFFAALLAFVAIGCTVFHTEVLSETRIHVRNAGFQNPWTSSFLPVIDDWEQTPETGVYRAHTALFPHPLPLPAFLNMAFIKPGGAIWQMIEDHQLEFGAKYRVSFFAAWRNDQPEFPTTAVTLEAIPSQKIWYQFDVNSRDLERGSGRFLELPAVTVPLDVVGQQLVMRFQVRHQSLRSLQANIDAVRLYKIASDIEEQTTLASFQSTEQDDLISTTNEEQLLTTDVAFITTEQVTSDPVSTTGDLATSLTTSVSTPSLVLLPVLNPSFEIDMLGGFLARGHVQFWKASHGVLTSRPGSSDILLSGTHIPDGSQVLLLLHMTEVDQVLNSTYKKDHMYTLRVSVTTISNNSMSPDLTLLLCDDGGNVLDTQMILGQDILEHSGLFRDYFLQATVRGYDEAFIGRKICIRFESSGFAGAVMLDHVTLEEIPCINPSCPLFVSTSASTSSTQTATFSRIPQFLSQPQPEDLGQVVVRINVGGNLYRDTEGQEWLPDEAYVIAGRRHSIRSSNICGTNRNPLYRSERYRPSREGPLVLHIPIINPGLYHVFLHFAETYGGIEMPGDRVFDIYLNDHLAIEGYDTLQENGMLCMGVRAFSLFIENDFLEIRMIGQVQNPHLSGVEIYKDIER